MKNLVGVGDVNIANKLAQWAYYAEPSSHYSPTRQSDVEKVLERAQELSRRWPEKISGRLVPVLYTLVAETPAVQKARELKIWLIESRKEIVRRRFWGLAAPTRKAGLNCRRVALCISRRCVSASWRFSEGSVFCCR